ncbi:MAG TPA: LOG family protein [Anaerolineae bacterium]
MNNSNQHTIAVFGGSQIKTDSPAYREAYRVGELIARNGFVLINGGYSGTMEASARGAREAGGRVLGVSSKLFDPLTMNPFVQEEIPTDDLYSTIRELVMRSDGYIVLKGSHGTLAELAIVWNLAAIDPHFVKPIVLLGDFWTPILEGFEQYLTVTREISSLLHIVSTPDQAIAYLMRALPQPNPLPPSPSPKP